MAAAAVFLPFPKAGWLDMCLGAPDLALISATCHLLWNVLAMLSRETTKAARALSAGLAWLSGAKCTKY